LFNNDYELSSNFVGNASFVNGTQADQTYPYVGTLKVAAKAKTYIDSNNGGEIVLAELNPTDFTIHKAKKAEQYSNADYGTIKYFLNDKKNSKLELKNSPVTEVVASVDVELANTWTYTGSDSKTKVLALDKLVMNGGTLEIAKTTKAADGTDVPVAKVTELEINGNVLVAETINSVAKITINADATLGVPVNTVLSVTDLTVINTVAANAANGEEESGELIVNGELNLSSVNGDKNGIYGTVKSDGTYEWTNNASGTKNITLHKGVMITAKANDTTAADAAAALQAKYDNALAGIWSEYLNFFKTDGIDLDDLSEKYGRPWYWNPTDIDWFAYELNTYYSYSKTPDVKTLVDALFGDDLADYTGETDSEKKVKAIKAKLNATNFSTAVTNSIYWTTNAEWGLATTATTEDLAKAKADFKDDFITKTGLFTSSAKAEVVQVSEVFETEVDAYKSVLANFSKPADGEYAAKFANVWNLITTDEIKAALLDEEAGEFTAQTAGKTVLGKYVFVWEDCDLDKVVKEMKKYSLSDWKAAYSSDNGALKSISTDNDFYSIAGVKAFLKAGALEKSASPVVDASAIATTYYSASQTWEYSDDQVAELQGAQSRSFRVGAPVLR